MKYSLLSRCRSELMGIAMIAVMLFHAFDLNLGLTALNYMRSLGFGGVDIFVLLSGMGLAMSQCVREREYGDFMARRLRRILPAYFAVMLPYTLYLIIAGRAGAADIFWNSTLLSYWVKNPGQFNWYVTGIVGLYAVTPPAVRALRSSRRRLPALLAVALVSTGISQTLMRCEYWNYLDIIYRVPLYTAGMVIGIWIFEERPFTAKDGVLWAVSLILGAAYLAVRERLGPYAQLAYLFTFTTVPVCLVISWLFEKLPLGALRGALRFVGENSLEIYLLNVSLFAEAGFLRRFFDPGRGHYAYYAAAFALNILLGWALHRAVGWAVEAFSRRREKR